jgi:hypothetical protein
MGLLDSLGNLSPEQTQGLLAAAAQMLQQSGPSRTPTSFGQVMGGGLGAYQGAMAEAKQRKMQEEQAAQVKQLRSMQIRDGESDFANQEAARKRAEALRQFYMANGNTGAPSGAGPTPELPPLGATPMASLPGMAAPQPQGQGQGHGGTAIYQQRLAMADKLRGAGFAQEADAQEASALKFMPKVKDWKQVQQNGQVMFAPYFEDGGSGPPVPLEVAEKLHFADNGQNLVGQNPFTGAVVSKVGKQQTFESQASERSAAAARAQADRHFNSNFGLAKDRLQLDREEATTKAAAVKAPTEFQGKSAAYGLRATEADKILTGLTGKFNPAAINSKQNVQDWPLVGGALGAVTNKLALSDNDQMAEQAQRDFVNAVLRQESGAAIGEPEFLNAKRQYFPQPGDSAAVIAQKATNRQLAIQGLQSNAGRAAMTAPAKSTGWSIKKVD